MSYLLDTNACIQLMTATRNPVRDRVDEVADVGQFFLSSVVLFELQFGIYKSVRFEQSTERLRRFLSAGMTVLEFTAEDARVAAQVRAELEGRRQPIGPFDTLIAGQAMARGLVLVTANVREFRRVKGLRWEDWSAKRR